MRSTSLIDTTSMLCEAKSALISERKDTVLLTILSRASVSSFASVGVIITLITARSSLDLVEIAEAMIDQIDLSVKRHAAKFSFL